jgi:hypothetical protein
VHHRHAPSAEGVTVRLQLTRAMLRLEVEDSGYDGAIATRPPGRPGGGFGLNIVRALSDRWGVERSAELGTRVWAQLARTPPLRAAVTTPPAPPGPAPMPHQHHERPAGALAHGVATARDIERIRKQLTAARARPSGRVTGNT